MGVDESFSFLSDESTSCGLAFFSFVSDESTSLHNCFSEDLYIIDFQTMPRGLGLALDRLRGVLGVIWRRVGVSGKRRGEFFQYL